MFSCINVNTFNASRAKRIMKNAIIITNKTIANLRNFQRIITNSNATRRITHSGIAIPKRTISDTYR